MKGSHPWFCWLCFSNCICGLRYGMNPVVFWCFVNNFQPKIQIRANCRTFIQNCVNPLFPLIKSVERLHSYRYHLKPQDADIKAWVGWDIHRVSQAIEKKVKDEGMIWDVHWVKEEECESCLLHRATVNVCWSVKKKRG